MKSLGQRIHDLREENNYTQKYLADLLNVGKSTFSQYESDTRIPSDEIKKQLASIFHVSLDYLLGVSDIRNPYHAEGAEAITEIDPDLRAIQRAREKMTPEQKDKMMKVLNAAFDDFFEDK